MRPLKPFLRLEEFVNENIKIEDSVNEGSVKSFDMAIDQLIANVKDGYGWIDPDYTFDALEAIDDEIDWKSFKSIKDEVYNRLIKAGILFYSDDENPEQRGTKVTNLNQLGESVVNEDVKGFVDANLLNDVKDLRKGSSVKIDALDYTRRGDNDSITCIRPDGNKMEILKKMLTVKL